MIISRCRTSSLRSVGLSLSNARRWSQIGVAQRAKSKQTRSNAPLTTRPGAKSRDDKLTSTVNYSSGQSSTGSEALPSALPARPSSDSHDGPQSRCQSKARVLTTILANPKCLQQTVLQFHDCVGMLLEGNMLQKLVTHSLVHLNYLFFQPKADNVYETCKLPLLRRDEA
jgi:hypothetical protein